jgi:uncharacterized protein
MENILWQSGSSHDIDHTLRVRDLSMKIWKIEWADLEILEIAALLHDIWRPKEFETKWEICHAEYWSQLAKQFLQDIWFDDEKTDKITYCIATHRLKKWEQPETLEAKILFDADKLDCIWAVWIWRAFMCAAEIWSKLHNDKWTNIENTKEYSKDDTAYREYILNLRKVKDKMFTETWKRLAEKRHNLMEVFFDELLQETRYNED